jgi:aryl-alcohol dehydrogenase-like predicted oxidoreductase
MKLQFGTGSRFGRLNSSLASRLVDYALSKGITSFDTGFNYGEGSSQALLASCLKSHIRDNREDLTISSKSGTLLKSQPGLKCFKPDYIDHTISASVRLFGDTYLDTYFLHGPTSMDLSSPKLISCLEAHKSSGLIRSIGVNTHDYSLMKQIANGNFGYVSSVMIDYNLIQQDRSDVIDLLVGRGISVVAGTALCQGLLLQSPLSLLFRSRSIFYLCRLLFKSSSRRFVAPCRIARKILRDRYPQHASSLPLGFLLSDKRISAIPVGMLSHSSIDANILASSMVWDPTFISMVACDIRENLPSF